MKKEGDDKMKIGVIGLGRLGLPFALAISLKGHEVKGYDNNINRMTKDWFKEKEAGVGDLSIQSLLKNSTLQFNSFDNVIRLSEIIFIVVDTPPGEENDGSDILKGTRSNYNLLNLRCCLGQAWGAIKTSEEKKIVVIVSTVLPGTIKKIALQGKPPYVDIIHNPQFCAMGTVIPDFYNPEFVLLGGTNNRAIKKMIEFYKTITDSPIFQTNIENAEMIKCVYNGFITMKINYANTLMEMAHKIPECDVDEVVDCLSLANKRLLSSAYLRGGMADGGSCHPKEGMALSYLATELDLSYNFFQQNMICREKQTEWLADLIGEVLRMTGYKKVWLFGMAFKPETNLEDGSPAILLWNILHKRGIIALTYDPIIDPKIHLKIDGQSIIFISTKHKIFQSFKFPKGAVVIDPFRYIEQKEGIRVMSIGAKWK